LFADEEQVLEHFPLQLVRQEPWQSKEPDWHEPLQLPLHSPVHDTGGSKVHLPLHEA